MHAIAHPASLVASKSVQVIVNLTLVSAAWRFALACLAQECVVDGVEPLRAEKEERLIA
jgi:hypothetical protein